jgi:hypothetical protein
MVMAVFVALATLGINKGRREKLLVVVVLPAVIWAVFTTQSRTPFVMFVSGSLVAWLLMPTARKPRLVAIAGVLLVIAAFSFNNFVNKWSNAALSVVGASSVNSWHGSTIDMRMDQLLVATHVFSENPVLGGGFSKTRSLIGAPGYEDLYDAESALFVWAINMGGLGVLAFFLLIGQVGVKLFREIRPRPVRAWLFGMWIGYGVFIFGTGVMQTMQFFLIIVVLALAACGRGPRVSGSHLLSRRTGALGSFGFSGAQPIRGDGCFARTSSSTRAPAGHKERVRDW